MRREQQLVETFVEVADTLVDDFDPIDFLHRMTKRCVQLLDIDAAGLLLADQHGALSLMASSSEQARLVELFALQHDEGPCLDCYRSGEPVAHPDLAQPDPPWPRFVALARESGFRGVYSLPMRLRADIIGVLSLFRLTPGQLSIEDLRVARAIADVATISLLYQRVSRERLVLVEQLQTALNSRIAIEQAKGVLAERLGLDMDGAFALLRDHARRAGRLLSAVAADVIAGRLTPTVPPEEPRRGSGGDPRSC
ncbi:MAG TPA: GAF and ANTAR domain-containing protein [Pilimelia sp.]|nr:GAF and ANTAR domain-containing protein [Pilimelia sp.]